MQMSSPLKIRVSSKYLREFLESPSWHLWKKCKAELEIKPKTREFTLTQTKMVIGWFFLYRTSAKDRSKNASLIAYYRCFRDKDTPRFLVPLTGRQILDLPDRPSKATLYRRGLKADQCYDTGELERLLKREICRSKGQT